MRATFLWNSQIKSLVDAHLFSDAIYLYYRMLGAHVRPDYYTFPLVNKAITAHGNYLVDGKRAQCAAYKMGFGSDIYICNTQVEMYSKFGDMSSACKLFDEIIRKDIVSWTSLMSGYVRCQNFTDAFLCFGRMQLVDVKPNTVTLLTALQACCLSGNVTQGQKFHCYIIKSGMEGYLSLTNSVLTMYSRIYVEGAEKLFNNMIIKDAVSWNVMTSAYSLKHDVDKTIKTFRQILLEDVSLSAETITSVVSVCGKSMNLLLGKEVHSFAIRNDIEDVVLQTAITDMYCKCGQVSLAENVFDRIEEGNSVTWSRMICGYAENGFLKEAFSLFKQMQVAGIEAAPDTLRCLISACSNRGSFQFCMEFHGYLIRNRFCVEDKSVATALVVMYAKCGSIVYAGHCFNLVSEKDVILYTAMMECFALHGCGLEALQLLDKMRKEGLEPNSVTFLSLLSACNHAGLVEEGCQIFNFMLKDSRTKTGLDHYTCMVDLLGRSGHLHEALRIIRTMPVEPDSAIWGALLGACRIHLNVVLSEIAAKHLFDLEPMNTGYQVVLRNIHSSNMSWEKNEHMRKVMEKGRLKNPGWSCLEIGKELHGFTCGDRTHPSTSVIYGTLNRLSRHIEESGLQN